MDIVFDLLSRFTFKWFNRVNLETPIETWSALEWMVFCVIILILFSILYMFFKGYVHSGKVVFTRKKKR